MSFDYAQSAQEALAILQDFDAKPCVVTVTAPAPDTDDYDPANGTGATPVPLTVTALGVILDYPVLATSYDNQADALIKAGDRKVILAAINTSGGAIAADQVPEEAQILAPNGITYTVAASRPLAPTGEVVLFILNVRPS
jgi:hypothetical protein